MKTEVIEKLQKMIDESDNIVFFGGAGVSTESGLKDFRSKDGLYNLKSKYGRPYEEMLSHHFFMEDPKTFYEFYKDFMLAEVKPNKAHIFLAALEKKKNLTIITQNIDGLHQEAGSKNVLELHGSIKRNYCMRCHKFFSLEELLSLKGDVPHCDKCGSLIKPDVVLYEEGLDNDVIEASLDAITNADLFIIAGTSLSVYPAASLVRYFKGKYLVVINKEHLYHVEGVDLEINAPVGETLSKIKI